MYISNHYQLGRALAAESPILTEHFLRRECFLFGNVIPDFIPLTYLHGFRETLRMTGHSLPHSAPKIEKNLRKRLSVGLRSCKDAFRLGMLTHYLADSFTYPHTERFSGKHAQHDRYERILRKIFPRYLDEIRTTPPADTMEYLANARRAYEAVPPSPENDAEWIVRVCAAVFFAVGSV